MAEHVLYGSSRLGTQNFWPTQYSFEYDVSKNAEQNKLLRQASSFHYRRGSYSYAYNGLIKSTEITPWGNAYVDKLGSSRILGLKRYELSNHLGNVQSVITDKITVAKQNQSATPPTPGVKRASLFASYDYYPFGMLMPERYVEDNTPQCIPTVRNGFVKQAIHIRDIPMDHTDAPHYMTNYGSNIQYTEGPPFQIRVTGMGARAHAFVSLPEGNLAPNKEFEFTTRTGRGDMLPSNVIVRVAQDDGTGNIVTLAQTNTLMMQSITLSATAISTEPLLVYYERPQINAVLLIEQGTYIVFDHVHADVIAQDCNSSDLGNDYRFGFNGQMKDNNLKGVGNSLDFAFRIHDARLGRFMSVDPLADEFPSLARYQFAGNSPILNIDLEGGEPYPYFLMSKWSQPFKTVMQTIDEKVNKANAVGAGYVRAHKLLTGSEAGVKLTISSYARGYLSEFGEFTDQNDISVASTGKNLDGTQATFRERNFAAAAIFLPVVSGKAVKYILEGFGVVASGYKYGNKVFKNAEEFETAVVNLGGNSREKRALIETVTRDVAKEQGWSKSSKLSGTALGDEVYDMGKGTFGSVDKMHGHIEIFKKQGSKYQHQGSINIDGVKNKERNAQYDVKL